MNFWNPGRFLVEVAAHNRSRRDSFGAYILLYYNYYYNTRAHKPKLVCLCIKLKLRFIIVMMCCILSAITSSTLLLYIYTHNVK